MMILVKVGAVGDGVGDGNGVAVGEAVGDGETVGVGVWPRAEETLIKAAAAAKRRERSGALRTVAVRNGIIVKW